MSQQQKFITFYTLLLTQAFSLLGSQMTSIALGVWIFTKTGNATPLTLVAFFGFLPRLLSAGIAGVAADRFDRRYVMALADAGQAVGTVATPAATASCTRAFASPSSTRTPRPAFTKEPRWKRRLMRPSSLGRQRAPPGC
jgi:MFS family permease